MAKRYQYYKYEGRWFKYDFEYAIVYYGCKYTEAKIRKEYKMFNDIYESLEDYRNSLNLDENLFCEYDGAGLRRENWKNKEVRHSYLSMYIEDMNEYMNYLY